MPFPVGSRDVFEETLELFAGERLTRKMVPRTGRDSETGEMRHKFSRLSARI